MNSVRIGDRDYPVVWQESPHIPGPVVEGYADFEDRLIVVATGQGRSDETDTILHECLHFILPDCKIQASDRAVCRLTSALIKYIRDNPEMIERIREDRNNER